MTAREIAMRACRARLEPGFAEFWNRTMTRSDRRFFLHGAAIEKSSKTRWQDFSLDEQAAILRAYGSMSVSAPAASGSPGLRL